MNPGEIPTFGWFGLVQQPHPELKLINNWFLRSFASTAIPSCQDSVESFCSTSTPLQPPGTGKRQPQHRLKIILKYNLKILKRKKILLSSYPVVGGGLIKCLWYVLPNMGLLACWWCVFSWVIIAKPLLSCHLCKCSLLDEMQNQKIGCLQFLGLLYACADSKVQGKKLASSNYILSFSFFWLHHTSFPALKIVTGKG